MCEYSKRLIAWMDGELAESEAAELEQHVQACAACRECVSAYEAASREFAGYYMASRQRALASSSTRGVPVWVPVAAAVAAVAAMLLFAFVRQTAKQAPAAAQVAVAPAKSNAGMENLVVHPPVKQDRTADNEISKAESPQGLKHSAAPVRIGTANNRTLRPGVSGTSPASTKPEWAMAEPAIQIAIPADAMFPPGAVPEGVTYIANVSLSPGGSVQGVRIQP
jgi:anti-sigma factor RsiW